MTKIIQSLSLHCDRACIENFKAVQYNVVMTIPGVPIEFNWDTQKFWFNY